MTVDLVKKHPNFVFAIVLISLITLQYAPRVIQGESILGHDTVWQFEPWYRFAWESISHGDWPFWNPYVFSGQPFLANPQVGLFYPPNWLLLLFPSSNTIQLIALLHVFLFGLFAFWFAKEIGLLLFPAAVSALALALSEFTAARLWAGHVDVLATASWLPLLFLVIRRLAKRESLQNILLGAFCTALILLAGFLQVAYLIFIAGGIYGIFLLFTEVSAERRLRVLVSYSLMAVGGIALCMVQLLPTYELLQNSSRGNGITYAFAIEMSLPPLYLITAVAPDFFGTIGGSYFDPITIFGIFLHETPTYIGIVALLLAIFAIRTRFSDRQVLFFGSLGTLFLILSMGKFTPVYRFFFDMVPGYNRFRVPAHHWLIVVFSLSILIGFGVQHIWQKREKAIFFYKTALILLVTLEIVAITGFVLKSFATELMVGYLVPTFLGWLGADMPLEETAMNSYQQFYDNALASLLLPILLLLGLCLWWLMLFKKRRNENASKATLAILIIGGLFAFNYHFVDPGLSYYQPATHFVSLLKERLVADSERSRVLFLQGDEAPSIASNVNAIGLEERIETADGYDPIILGDYARFVGMLIGTDEFSSTGKIFKSLERPYLLNPVNVRYVVSGKPLPEDISNLELMGQEDDVWLYKNTEALPRAYLVQTGNITLVKDQASAFAQLEAGIKQNSAIIESSSLSTGTNISSADSTGESSVSIVDYKNNYVRLNVKGAAPGYLILSDLYYPGWTAYVDGVEREILRANAIFRAIPVEPGDHVVEFRFIPSSLPWGTLISGATLLIFCLLMARLLLRRLNTKQHSPSRQGNLGKQAIKI